MRNTFKSSQCIQTALLLFLIPSGASRAQDSTPQTVWKIPGTALEVKVSTSPVRVGNKIFILNPGSSLASLASSATAPAPSVAPATLLSDKSAPSGRSAAPAPSVAPATLLSDKSAPSGRSVAPAPSVAPATLPPSGRSESGVIEGEIAGVREIAGVTLYQIDAPVTAKENRHLMLDKSGELLGIITARLYEGKSIFFAVPAEQIFTNAKGSGDSVALVSRRLNDISDLAIAWGLMLNKEYQNADKYLNRATATRDSGNAMAWHLLGYARGKLGSWAKAITCYRRSARLKPENPPLWHDLGFAQGQLKQYREAAEAYRKAVKLKPDFALAWFNLGATYGMLSQDKEAVDAYRAAVKINPRYASAWNNLGGIYAKTGQDSDAITAFRMAIKHDPKYVKTAFYSIGLRYESLGQFDGAIRAYLEALRSDSNNARIWYSLGVAYDGVRPERHEDGIQAYRQALKLTPDDAFLWYTMGIAYLHLKDPASAQECLQQLERLDPDRAQVLKSTMAATASGT